MIHWIKKNIELFIMVSYDPIEKASCLTLMIVQM
jgi:hypothetical protein